MISRQATSKQPIRTFQAINIRWASLGGQPPNNEEMSGVCASFEN